ncbi:hypothetical protein UBN76_10580 [Helicobacter pylori]
MLSFINAFYKKGVSIRLLSAFLLLFSLGFAKDLEIQSRVQFMMPEMPGMPMMKEMAQVSEKNGIYEAKTNLSMNGTWQVRVDIKSKEGQVYRAKTSLDL